MYFYHMQLCSEEVFFATSKKCVQKILYRTWDAASSGSRLRKATVRDLCKKKNEKQQKNLSFVKDLNSNKAFCVFQVCAKLFHCRSNPYRNLSFLYYFCCFCKNPIRYPYTSGSLRRHTLFRHCKKDLF